MLTNVTLIQFGVLLLKLEAMGALVNPVERSEYSGYRVIEDIVGAIHESPLPLPRKD